LGARKLKLGHRTIVIEEIKHLLVQEGGDGMEKGIEDLKSQDETV